MREESGSGYSSPGRCGVCSESGWTGRGGRGGAGGGGLHCRELGRGSAFPAPPTADSRARSTEVAGWRPHLTAPAHPLSPFLPFVTEAPGFTVVLFSSGHCKSPGLSGLDNRHLWSPVLEAGRPRSRCGLVGSLVRALFLVDRHGLRVGSSQGGEEEPALGPLLVRALIPG